jgi:HSP20 family protein
MTTLTKKQNGHHGLQTWRNPFDRFFGGNFMDLWQDEMLTVPSINISEEKNNYKIEMAAPGLKKEDINIDVNNNVITISSETESEYKSDGDKKEKKEEMYSRREYNYSSFSRSFSVPENADTENIKAKYENGVLQLTVPKKQQSSSGNGRKVKIE